MKKVFLDANIVIEVGKPPYGPEFSTVIDLVETEGIRILTTNLTMAEVIKFHTLRDFKEMKSFCNPKLRKMVEETINFQIPTITEKQLREVLREKYRNLVEDMFQNMDAKLLNISDVNSHNVFYDYFHERGLFADGNGKKHQFPDAFVFERLKDEASENEPIIIVSKDKDFARPANEENHLSLVSSLPSLFNELGLKLEDPEIAKFLAQHYDVLKKMINDELSSWRLMGDIEFSEIINTEVTSFVFHNTMAFESTEKGGSILVVGRFLVSTMVDFTHPDESTGFYDPDENRRVFFDFAHSKNKIDLPIQVSLSIAVDDNGNPVEIKRLGFRSDDFIHIELDPHGPYWKSSPEF